MNKRVALCSIMSGLVLLSCAPVYSQVITQGPYMIYPNDPTRMTILWCSESSNPALNTLMLYSDPGYDSLIGGPYNIEFTTIIGTAFQYKYTLENLFPGTKYYYRVRVGTTNYDGSFRSGPPVGATSTNFMVYTDTHSGTGPHNTEAGFINTIYNSVPDFQTLLLSCGDLVDPLEDFGYNSYFFNAGTNVSTMLRNLPFESARGNHDIGLNNYTLFFPYSGSSFYSFDYGPVHFAVADFGADLTSMIRDLSNSRKPWNFIITHHAGYCAGGYHYDNPAIKEAITFLNSINVYVAVVFGGHQHYYSHAAFTENMGFKTRHITNGTAGGDIRQPTANEYTVSCAAVRSFSKVEILSDCLMKIHTIDGSNGKEIETITIDRPCGVMAENISGCRALISWNTSLPSETIVYYGTTLSYGSVANGNSGTSHTVALEGLIPNTTYHYRVESNGERSKDYTFTTSGDVISWTGFSDSDWKNPENWCGGSVPDSSADVVIPHEANQPGIKSDSLLPVICRSLTIEDGAELTLNAGEKLTVINDLINNGTVIIGSDTSGQSGSVIIGGNSSGTGKVVYNRKLLPYLINYLSSPVQASPVPLSPSILEWDESTGLWQKIVGSTFKSGVGFAIGEPAEMSLSFTGSLVTSASCMATAPFDPGYPSYFKVRENKGGDGWNLLGNPFMSCLKTSEFINANSESFDPNYKALYTCDGSRWNYSGFSVPFVAGMESQDDYIEAGQGFFVRANRNNASFTFDRTMQVHNPSPNLMKSSLLDNDPWPGVLLKVRYLDKENTTLIVYNKNMTTGPDPGYDIGFRSFGSDIEVYTKLVRDNGLSFMRQCLPFENYDKNIVPVGITCPKGGNIIFSAIVDHPDNFRFYLLDVSYNKFTDLDTEAYTVNLPPGTNGTGRFYIYASPDMPTSVDSISGFGNQVKLRIWTFNNVINIVGRLSGQAEVEIYNILGVKLFESQLPGSDFNSVPVPSIKRGVYFVKIRDGSKYITRKVIF